MPKNVYVIPPEQTLPADSAVLDVEKIKGKQWSPKEEVAPGVDASYLFMMQDGCQNFVIQNISGYVKEKDFGGTKKIGVTMVLDKTSECIDPLLSLDRKAEELAREEEKMSSGEPMKWVSLLYQPPPREQLAKLAEKQIKKKDLKSDPEADYLIIGKVTKKTRFVAYSKGRIVPIQSHQLFGKKITGSVTINPRVFANVSGGTTLKHEAPIIKFLIKSFDSGEPNDVDDPEIQEMMVEGGDGLDLSGLGITPGSSSSPTPRQTEEDVQMSNDLSALVADEDFSM